MSTLHSKINRGLETSKLPNKCIEQLSIYCILPGGEKDDDGDVDDDSDANGNDTDLDNGNGANSNLERDDADDDGHGWSVN